MQPYEILAFESCFNRFPKIQSNSTFEISRHSPHVKLAPKRLTNRREIWLCWDIYQCLFLGKKRKPYGQVVSGASPQSIDSLFFYYGAAGIALFQVAAVATGKLRQLFDRIKEVLIDNDKEVILQKYDPKHCAIKQVIISLGCIAAILIIINSDSEYIEVLGNASSFFVVSITI